MMSEYSTCEFTGCARRAIFHSKESGFRCGIHEPVKTPSFRNLGRETVNHPPHYGGADSPYEAIKVIEAWGLGFHLGNSVKYIARAGKKGDELEDLRKAAWYLQRRIEQICGAQ